MTPASPRIGAVVIGRNEGVRLQRCLDSLHSQLMYIVYVDSGSTDNSLAIADLLGIETVKLDTTIPFTAGRARNAGFQRLIAMHSEIEFVQFIDGDCVLNENWLAAGISEFKQRSAVAVTCGRRREIDPKASLYNRQIDMEWDSPVGDCSASGGDFLIRTSCFRELGGFNPSIVAGEEPELGFRIRSRGWKISRIDQEMTRHDANMIRISSWWQRERRAGYGGIDVLHRTAGDPQSYFRRQVHSAWFWSLGWTGTLLCLLTIAGLLIGRVGVAVVALTWFGLTAIQLGRIARNYRRRGMIGLDSLKIAMLTLLGKWPQMLGQIAWYRDRFLGRQAALIEYKSPEFTKSLPVSKCVSLTNNSQT